MSDRIRIINCSGHKHAVRLMLPNGGYSHKSLQPNQFAVVNEEQFLDIYNSTRDFKCGYMTFDRNTLSEELVSWLGLETVEELNFGVIGYTDAEIREALKGNVGKFNSFVKEVKEVDKANSGVFFKRLFEIASSMAEEITQSKAKTIEEITGMNFDINAEFKNSK